MEYKDSDINIVNTADSDWEESILDCEKEGELIFAYKNTNTDLNTEGNEVLYQVIVKRSYNPDRRNKFSVNIVTSTVSYMYNLVPLRYIQCKLLDILRNFKVDDAILANFEQILEDLEK